MPIYEYKCSKCGEVIEIKSEGPVKETYCMVCKSGLLLS